MGYSSFWIIDHWWFYEQKLFEKSTSHKYISQYSSNQGQNYSILKQNDFSIITDIFHKMVKWLWWKKLKKISLSLNDKGSYQKENYDKIMKSSTHNKVSVKCLWSDCLSTTPFSKSLYAISNKKKVT